MTLRFGTALGALTLALGLGACGGGGSSEFTTKYVEICKAEGGDKKMGDCGCQATVLDKELDAKEKKMFLIFVSAMAPGGDPKKMEEQMKAEGITEAEFTALEKKIEGLEDKVEKECKK